MSEDISRTSLWAVLLTLLLLFLLSFALTARADTIVSGTISTDTTWSPVNGIYIIEGNLFIPSNVTLTIGPGAIIKFKDNVWLNVYEGNIRAEGTLEAPIYFTSEHDDSVGGDINGDGDNRLPGYNDRWGVNIGYSSLSSFTHTNIKYTYGGIFSWKTNLNLDSVNITDSEKGVIVATGGRLMANDVIMENVAYDGLVGYQESYIVASNVHLKNIWNGDAIVLYNNSVINLTDSSVRDMGGGSALGLYSSHANVQNSTFSGGLDAGIELYSDFSGSGSTLSLQDSLVEEYSDTGLGVYNSSIQVGRSIFRNNYYSGVSIYNNQSNRTFNISGSAFYGNLWYALEVYSNVSVNARDNWWGDLSGPFESISNPSGLGDEIYGNIEFNPWLTEPPSEEPERNPVIIVPGIAGTELYNGDDLVWPDLLQMLFNINDQFLTDSLNLNEQGYSIEDISTGETVKKILDVPVFEVDIFESLINKLNEAGYEENQTYFFLPYDWRLNLETTKALLNQKIEELKLQTGKVDIIAHSMGGLLTKAYLDTYGNDAVDKLIFVGTPHLGAPKAGKVILQGDRFGIPWLENDRIKEIAENSPAIHQLLPSKTYFDQFQGYIKVYGDNQLRDYESTKTFFVEDNDKNPLMFQIAEAFSDKNYHDTNLDGLDVYNIVGCKQSTQSAYFIGGLGAITKIGYSSGDGTVPLVSADYISTLSSNKFYVKNGDHAELSSTDGVRELIAEILNGGTGILSNNISSSSSFCNFKGKTLNWRSPVEIHIYDQFNNHTGPIENNAIEYSIPNIDYEIIGHEKFIFLPTDEGQLYRVEAVGTDDGTFDLLISENENGLVLETSVFNDIPVGTSTQVQFEVSNVSEDNVIEIKVGEEDPVLVETNLILNSEESEDVIPPETQIILTGKEYQDGEYKKEVEVSLNVTDDNSGVLETNYSLDGQNFFPYTGTFTLGIEGVYNVYYYSVDRAGNNEEIKSVEVIIGKLSKILRKIED